MRKILPAVFLVVSCGALDAGAPDRKIVYRNALERSAKETDPAEKLRILDEAIFYLDEDSGAFELQKEIDKIRAARERRSCSDELVGTSEYQALWRKIDDLKADADPRVLSPEVRGFVQAYGRTVLALKLRLHYRSKILDYDKAQGRNPIVWGAELPKLLVPAGQEKPSGEEIAREVASSAIGKARRSSRTHSINIRELIAALDRVRKLDPTGPSAEELQKAIAREKKALERQCFERAERVLIAAVASAEGKDPRARLEQLEAIADEVADTPIESRWQKLLGRARGEFSEDLERKERERRAKLTADAALADAKKCGLDYEKAAQTLRSALAEIKGTGVEDALAKRLGEAERHTPERLNKTARRLLKAGKVDRAIGLLKQIVKQEDSTGRIAHSGNLAFAIGDALAKDFSAYPAKTARDRKFTSSYDEAVYYFVYAASRGADADGRLMRAAELLLKMKLKERAKVCLKETLNSPSPKIRDEARKRLEEIDAPSVD